MSNETYPPSPAQAFTEAEYYARQTRLPEVGAAGQAKLRAGKVLVVGAGGLGCPALSFLAAAGVGTLGICERDQLEASNLHRQTLYNHTTVGEKKARLAAQRLREQNPFITLRLHEDGLTPENVMSIFSEYDLVLDCTDNFATKFLVNDAAVLSKKPAIIASIYQYEGQLLVIEPAAGGPCLRCLWPEMPEPDCVGSCAEVGVLGAVPGLLGTMQAIEVIKRLLGLGEPLRNDMIIFDCLSYSTQRVRMPQHPACPVCGDAPRITSIQRDEYLPPEDIDLDVRAWRPEQFRKYRFIDIREAAEVAFEPIGGIEHDHIPMSAWDPDNLPIRPDEPCLLCCAHGIRSLRLTEHLRKRGYTKVYSVKRGLHGLA